MPLSVQVRRDVSRRCCWCRLTLSSFSIARAVRFKGADEFVGRGAILSGLLDDFRDRVAERGFVLFGNGADYFRDGVDVGALQDAALERCIERRDCRDCCGAFEDGVADADVALRRRRDVGRCRDGEFLKSACSLDLKRVEHSPPLL